MSPPHPCCLPPLTQNSNSFSIIATILYSFFSSQFRYYQTIRARHLQTSLLIFESFLSFLSFQSSVSRTTNFSSDECWTWKNVHSYIPSTCSPSSFYKYVSIYNIEKSSKKGQGLFRARSKIYFVPNLGDIFSSVVAKVLKNFQLHTFRCFFFQVSKLFRISLSKYDRK